MRQLSLTIEPEEIALLTSLTKHFISRRNELEEKILLFSDQNHLIQKAVTEERLDEVHQALDFLKKYSERLFKKVYY